MGGYTTDLGSAPLQVYYLLSQPYKLTSQNFGGSLILVKENICLEMKFLISNRIKMESSKLSHTVSLCSHLVSVLNSHNN